MQRSGVRSPCRPPISFNPATKRIHSSKIAEYGFLLSYPSTPRLRIIECMTIPLGCGPMCPESSTGLYWSIRGTVACGQHAPERGRPLDGGDRSTTRSSRGFNTTSANDARQMARRSPIAAPVPATPTAIRSASRAATLRRDNPDVKRIVRRSSAVAPTVLTTAGLVSRKIVPCAARSDRRATQARSNRAPRICAIARADTRADEDVRGN